MPGHGSSCGGWRLENGLDAAMRCDTMTGKGRNRLWGRLCCWSAVCAISWENSQLETQDSSIGGLEKAGRGRWSLSLRNVIARSHACCCPLPRFQRPRFRLGQMTTDDRPLGRGLEPACQTPSPSHLLWVVRPMQSEGEGDRVGHARLPPARLLTRLWPRWQSRPPSGQERAARYCR